jgi:hypothetical protein
LPFPPCFLGTEVETEKESMLGKGSH